MKNRTVYLKVVGAIFLWSGIPIAGHILAEKGIDAFRISFMRFSLAAACLWVYLLIFCRRQLQKSPISLQTVRSILVLSFVGLFVHNILLMHGIARLPASETNAILATTPTFVALAAVLCYQERLSLINWLGIAISCLGAITVVTNGRLSEIMHVKSLSGVLFLIAAMITWSLYTMITKKYAEQNNVDPTVLFAYCFLVTSILLLLSSPYWPQSHITLSTWLSDRATLWCSVAFVVSTAFPYAWTAEGVKKIGPAQTTIFSNLLPVFGIMQAIIILSEKPTPIFYVGTAITLAGIFLVTGTPTRAVP